MITLKSLSLNLASHPLRNRRFFYLLFSFLGIVFLLVAFSTGQVFLKYKSRAQEIKASILKTDQMIMNAQRDKGKYSDGVEDAVKSYKEKVDLINDIILKKSFSWVEFLTDLESALPDSSYIISLAPMLTKDSKMQLKFKVASLGLNDLIKLINNLNALGFSQINLISEEENNRGLLLSEISLTYKKDV